jgi:hypothetical protein
MKAKLAITTLLFAALAFGQASLTQHSSAPTATRAAAHQITMTPNDLGWGGAPLVAR